MQNQFIAFLRGINVGGKSIIKMAELKEVVEKSGFKNVKTYIQSGNILFESDDSTKNVTNRLEKDLSKRFGIKLIVVVKTKKELREILRRVPKGWENGNDLRRYLAFVKEPKKAGQVVEESIPKEGIDSIKAGKGVVYMTTILSGKSKSGLSRLAGKEIYKYLTIRNYNTVEKIFDLMNKNDQ